MTELARRLARHRQGRLGALILTLLMAAALFGPAVAPYDAEEFHIVSRLEGPSAAFWLGTDQFGRDILSRILAGARETILLSLLATGIGTLIGTLIGVTSAYLGGAADDIIMRIVDALISIPNLLFALLIVTVLGPSGVNAVVAIGIAFAPGLSRVARSATLVVRELDYVNAARARGEGAVYMIAREILPNAAAPIIVEATIRVSFAIMLFATLSFLGLGAQPPAPEWGLMVAEARPFLFRNLWTIACPGLAIALVAIGFNLLGDGLRDVLNPRIAERDGSGP